MQPSRDWRSRKGTEEEDEAAEAAESLLGRTQPGEDASSRHAEEGALLSGRALALMVFFVLILVGVVVRLVYWTVIPAAGTSNRIAPVPAEQPRGRIVDRNGLLMATDTFYGEVYARPKQIAEDTTGAGRQAVISGTIALEQPVETILASVPPTTSLVMLAKHTTQDQCDNVNKIKDEDLIWCDYKREMSYPQNSVAAHVLGFVNSERIGLYGIEARYDNWLNPALKWPGSLPVGIIPMPEKWKLYLPSPAGHDVVLNLDVPLQYVVEKQLQDAVSRYRAEAGTIIVMDPRTGAVLAMANSPTFDPNQFSSVPENTWVNSAISKIYEPGSVFKLVTMAAGLDAGYITPDTQFTDEGSLAVGGRVVRNAERKGYGNVTVRDALALSLNVVSAKIALRMGAETFYRYVGQFGFGKPTEVDLQEEVNGIVKQPDNGTGWSEYDLAANSFGQGISTTPFQMINAAAAIANRGVMLQPQVVQAMVEDGRVHPISPRELGRPIRPDTALALTQMMVYTVDESSLPDLVPGYRVAGKTGTAEIPTDEGYTSLESIMSFIGFLPAADPQLVIMVKLDRPKGVYWAEQAAMPLWGQVAREAVRILDVKPDDRKP